MPGSAVQAEFIQVHSELQVCHSRASVCGRQFAHHRYGLRRRDRIVAHSCVSTGSRDQVTTLMRLPRGRGRVRWHVRRGAGAP